MNLKKYEDWYKIKQSDFVDNGGGGILKYYENSHIRAIADMMPGIYLFIEITIH